MKPFYYINLVALIVTLIGWCTICLGLYLQPLMGAWQVFSSLIYLTVWQTLRRGTQRMLLTYYTIVTVYLIIFIIPWIQLYGTPSSPFIGKGRVFLWYYFIIPMVIAIFFVRISWQVSRDHDAYCRRS